MQHSRAKMVRLICTLLLCACWVVSLWYYVAVCSDVLTVGFHAGRFELTFYPLEVMPDWWVQVRIVRIGFWAPEWLPDGGCGYSRYPQDSVYLPIWCMVIWLNWPMIRFVPQSAGRWAKAIAGARAKRYLAVMMAFVLFFCSSLFLLYFVFVVAYVNLFLRTPGEIDFTPDGWAVFSVIATSTIASLIPTIWVTRLLHLRLLQTSRLMSGCCAKCGYNLIGAPPTSRVCPECGNPTCSPDSTNTGCT